ncbi:MAG: DUF4230 domain-containing protein [Eggerthellaceae bacterium]|nr:DUF4230 domain-containing protein [Eggerthellaceae bacterium]
MKKLLAGILVGILIAGGLAFYFNETGKVQEGETTYTTDIIANKLSDIAELSVLEYRYKNAASLDRDSSTLKFFSSNVDIPFTEKRLILTYEGIVKMGPDMSQASVDVDGNKVKVTIPHSTILSHELNEESFEYLVQDSGLFNPLKPEDDGALRKEQKGVIEKSIEENGLLDEADKKAQAQITSFLEAFDPELEVSCEFKKA